MKRLNTRKPTSVDLEHMKFLHQEAIDQLELMHSALVSAQEASGAMRDRLEEMADNHWQAYTDILHMIALHDQILSEALKKNGLKMRSELEEEGERQIGRQALVLLLLLSLLRRHRRFYGFYGYRGHPMNDYLKDSMNMEREHLAELVSMVHDSL